MAPCFPTSVAAIAAFTVRVIALVAPLAWADAANTLTLGVKRNKTVALAGRLSLEPLSAVAGSVLALSLTVEMLSA